MEVLKGKTSYPMAMADSVYRPVRMGSDEEYLP